MNRTPALLFDWLFNALVQIGLFAALAAGLSRLVRKAKATYQHWFYLTVFALCVAAPTVNTFWHTYGNVAAERTQESVISGGGHGVHAWWVWNGRDEWRETTPLVEGLQVTLLAIWGASLIYELIKFGRGIDRVHRLRRDALSICNGDLRVGDLGIRWLKFGLPQGIALLESGAIDDPVTVGVFHPAIILPSKVLPSLGEAEYAAIFAHEYGHIRRKDFVVLLVCQLVAMPVAWHPGIQYLMSKISQTRELACDEYAAVSVGKRIEYARSLLRLASLCLQVPRGDAMGLGMFNADNLGTHNLEDRIMMLTEKRKSLSRAGLIGLALSTSFLFGSSAVLARAVSLQEASASNTAPTFAGTWHWMFHGQSFATMVLIQKGQDITGTVTESRIKLDDDGELSKADPSDNRTPSQITRTKLEGDALHVTVGDEKQPFEFIVTQKDATHAEIHPVGAPSNMKPIQAERVE